MGEGAVVSTRVVFAFRRAEGNFTAAQQGGVLQPAGPSYIERGPRGRRLTLREKPRPVARAGYRGTPAQSALALRLRDQIKVEVSPSSSSKRLA